MWPEIIYVTPRSCSVTRCSNNINGIAREAGNILTPVRCLVLVPGTINWQVSRQIFFLRFKYFSSDLLRLGGSKLSHQIPDIARQDELCAIIGTEVERKENEMSIQNIYCVCHLSSMKNIYTADFLDYYHNDSILHAGSASPTVSTCWWFEGFWHSSFQHCRGRGCGHICIALHSPADCWGGSESCWSWLFSCTPSIHIITVWQWTVTTYCVREESNETCRLWTFPRDGCRYFVV